jgi:hypothetical protein
VLAALFPADCVYLSEQLPSLLDEAVFRPPFCECIFAHLSQVSELIVQSGFDFLCMSSFKRHPIYFQHAIYRFGDLLFIVASQDGKNWFSSSAHIAIA